METIFDRFQRMALQAGNAQQAKNPELAKRVYADVEVVRKRMSADKEELIKEFETVLTAP